MYLSLQLKKITNNMYNNDVAKVINFDKRKTNNKLEHPVSV